VVIKFVQMKPEDLKNPEGLKSMQNEEDVSGNTDANEEKSNTLHAEEAESETQNFIDGTVRENMEKVPDVEDENTIDDSISEDQKQNEEGEDNSDETETSDKIPDGTESNAESEPENINEGTAPENNEQSEGQNPDKTDIPEGRDKAGEEEVKQDESIEEASKTEKPVSSNEDKREANVSGVAGTGKLKEEKEKKDSSEAAHEEDYSSYSLIELINELSDVLDKSDDHDVKDEVEAIKAAFYKKTAEEAEEQKKQFLDDGGNEEEYQEQENPYEQDMKELLKRYRQIRHEYNKKLEQEKEENLQKKYEIIEEIKGLIHKEESINKTFQEFRELQQRWRETGLVPQAKMKDLWDTYHFHVENFYDYIKINQELRDLDLKKNLEVKIKLCEQAEELLLEPSAIRAFNLLQKLHDRWREVGPVPRENKDDIWERFKTATAKINKKYQDFFENRKQEQKKNLEAKKALCEKVEEINELEINNHKDWSEKSKEVVNLQKVWRTIDFAPRKDNNKIYSRFRAACDKFFDAKRDFYSKNKELQQNNMQLKIDLCLQAEALKDSTDWRKATQDLINIQKQWKEIGPVPRKHSDVLWKRFRAACDHFFDRKSEHFSEIDQEQVENLNLKLQLIKEVENYKTDGDVDEKLKQLKDFQRRWTEIGHVPIKKKDEVQHRFREAINKLFDELKLDDSKRNLLKFRSKMVSFSESTRGQNKMRFERDKYMNKLKQLENDLVLLDNNIGFFAKSKNAESLIEDVQRKIEQTKEKIEFLKNKIRVIDEMDDSDE